MCFIFRKIKCFEACSFDLKILKLKIKNQVLIRKFLPGFVWIDFLCLASKLARSNVSKKDIVYTIEILYIIDSV